MAIIIPGSDAQFRQHLDQLLARSARSHRRAARYADEMEGMIPGFHDLPQSEQLKALGELTERMCPEAGEDAI